jgi:hypothetical protein
MADRSRDLTTGCFAASNSSGRPSRQVSTTKRNLVAYLPWAHTTLDSDNSVHYLYRIGLRIVLNVESAHHSPSIGWRFPD